MTSNEPLLRNEPQDDHPDDAAPFQHGTCICPLGPCGKILVDLDTPHQPEVARVTLLETACLALLLLLTTIIAAVCLFATDEPDVSVVVMAAFAVWCAFYAWAVLAVASYCPFRKEPF